jgi:hypothetical protein
MSYLLTILVKIFMLFIFTGNIFDLYIFLQMAQQQNRNNNDLNEQQNAVLERIEALEVCKINKNTTNQIKLIL